MGVRVGVDVDPGKIAIVTAVETVADGTEDSYELNVEEWRAACHANERIALTRTWCTHLNRPGGEFEALRAVTAKTADLAELLDFCLVSERVRPAILAEKRKARKKQAKEHKK